ncbi:Transmembrane protein 126 [Trinorchestia longiramus]|nr:Transmembrane protein 126 [Trinorchestia longiramus]
MQEGSAAGGDGQEMLRVAVLENMALNVSQAEIDAMHLIKTWTPPSDVWAFRYGSTTLVSSTALTAGYINYKFRKALKLKSFAFFSTYMATMCIPSVMASALHGIFVVAPTLSGKQMCPVCLETRSVALQAGISVAYPLLLAPIACFQFASRYMTAAIPPLWPQPQYIFKKYLSIVKPMANKLLILTAINMALAAGLVYGELENLGTVTRKLEQMERVVKESVSSERLQQIKSDTSPEKMTIISEPKVPFNFK